MKSDYAWTRSVALAPSWFHGSMQDAGLSVLPKPSTVVTIFSPAVKVGGGISQVKLPLEKGLFCAPGIHLYEILQNYLMNVRFGVMNLLVFWMDVVPNVFVFCCLRFSVYLLVFKSGIFLKSDLLAALIKLRDSQC